MTVRPPRHYRFSIHAKPFNRRTCRSGTWRVIIAIALIAWLQPGGTAQPLRAETTRFPFSRPVVKSVGAPSSDSHGLSPYWGPDIQQGGDYIVALSEVYGFHPDFIAALIFQELSDASQTAGGADSPGLMRIGSVTGGLDRQPPNKDIGTPANNLEWGMAILSHVVQETGGDLFTALAVYKSGWTRVNSPIPREFAAGVLESYARAVVIRSGFPVDTAANWTIAVELQAGNVPTDSLLVLGNRPFVGLHLMAEHTVYAHADRDGNMYYIRGFVVPVGYLDVTTAGKGFEQNDDLEAPLRARLGERDARIATGNPRVLLACLPSLERLRGQVTTRWYSPSTCPEPQR